jgi:hypothetical protein
MHGIFVGGAIHTSQTDVASTFSSVCSSGKYDPSSRATKDGLEELSQNFSSRVNEAENASFIMDKYLAVIQCVHWHGYMQHSHPGYRQEMHDSSPNANSNCR